MRVTLPSVVAVVALLSVGPIAAAQGTGGANPLPRDETIALRGLLDRVLAGEPAGGDAWLKWSSHFLRAGDGRVYVPFTIHFDEMTSAFRPVAMFVRVAPRGFASNKDDIKVTGAQLGVAVSAPERNFSRGNPTAGEASARLSQMTSELSAVPMPFEGFYTAPAITADAAEIQRSLVVAPGDYDLYIVVRERPRPGGPAPRTAVLQTELTVPDLTRSAPAMSSILLADGIARVGKRLSAAELEKRPYVINGTELSVRPANHFEPEDVLSVVFFVYNLAVNPVDTDKAQLKRLPDVTVQYRFRAMSDPTEVFGEMAPQRFSRDHDAPQFDERAGRQLAVTQALPLSAFPPDDYELDVLVTDNVAGRSLTSAARFTVGGGKR